MSTTIHEQVVEYLRHIRGRLAPATYKRKRLAVEAFARWCIANDRHLGDITGEMLGRYLLSRRHWSAQTRRMHWRTIVELYAVLGYAENPAQGIIVRHRRSPLPRIPSKDTMRRLFATQHTHAGVQVLRDRLMAELAYGSGLRREEMVTLDIEDIDLEQGAAYVHGKGGKTRVVPLTTAALAVLRVYLERRRATRGPLLIAERSGRRLSTVSVNWVFRERLRTRPHALRHACATHMLANGCSLRYIQELLGHVNLRSTQRYTHISKEGLAQVLTRHHPRARDAPDKAP